MDGAFPTESFRFQTDHHCVWSFGSVVIFIFVENKHESESADWSVNGIETAPNRLRLVQRYGPCVKCEIDIHEFALLEGSF